MKRATSRLTDTVTVHAGDVHRQIAPGDTVDLDEPIGGTTLAELLGPHVAGFELEKPESRSRKPVTEVAPSAPKE